jgi:RNA polymerase sigma-70 factor (ECF subfamily)
MLYDTYSVDVWRYVARMLGDQPADVADVVQETFLAAAKGARQFDPERGTLWSWLAGIAHNQSSLSWRRVVKGNRLRELAEAGAGELRRWLDGSAETDRLAERRESAELVRFVLANVPADYATLLSAKYLDERSLDEMAVQFGGSVEAIKSKLARARREFRRIFEQMTCDPTEMACD